MFIDLGLFDGRECAVLNRGLLRVYQTCVWRKHNLL